MQTPCPRSRWPIQGAGIHPPVRPVSEKAVELEAANLTRTHAPFAPVEKSAARGMRVTLDFEGFMDGAPSRKAKWKM